jgi:ankyrin repeat protein
MIEPMSIERGPDREGRTALHYAAMDGDNDAIQTGLDQGLDPRARDRSGYTPLHFSAQCQHAASFPLLLDSGAEVEAKDQWGNTPLFRAVFNSKGDGATIKALLTAGADPDASTTPASRPAR